MIHRVLSKFSLVLLAAVLVACTGEPRAVMLPLEYPDGSPVRTRRGDTMMAGYQTYGSVTHANATALYDQARPATCMTCAKVGAVVSEPSTLRQATGVLGTAAFGTGAVMTGIGIMDYGDAAESGKLRDKIYNSTTMNNNTRFSPSGSDPHRSGPKNYDPSPYREKDSGGWGPHKGGYGEGAMENGD